MTINNLYVKYDDDGNPVYLVNDEVVSLEVFQEHHPHMKKGQVNGGNIAGNSDRRSVGRGDAAGADDAAKEQAREGIRNARQAAKARSAGQGPDGVGQSGE